jgi:C4-dicarboxylate transporter DctM subunit
MPVILLGGLYGGLFTPTEAGAAAAGYALVYVLIAKRGAFVKELLPVTLRALNLTSVIFMLLGCVGVFQFVLAIQGWAQHLTDWVISFNFSAMGFLVVLLFLSMFLSGIAILVLTVPVFFPAAMSLGIDPGWLAVLVALHEVIKGSTPFLITDGPDHGRA